MCVYFHCAVCVCVCLCIVLLMFLIGICCFRAITCGSFVSLLCVMNSAILLLYYLSLSLSHNMTKELPL